MTREKVEVEDVEEDERGGGMYGNLYEGEESYLMISRAITRMALIWISIS